MKIIKNFDHCVNNTLIQDWRKGKCTDLKRTFLLLNPTDGKIAIVSLNIFERIVCVLQKIFCSRNYSQFEKVFKTKNIKIISTDMPSEAFVKVDKQHEKIQPPIALKEQVDVLPEVQIEGEKDESKPPLQKQDDIPDEPEKKDDTQDEPILDKPVPHALKDEGKPSLQKQDDIPAKLEKKDDIQNLIPEDK